MKTILRSLTALTIIASGIPMLPAQNLDLPYTSGSSGADGPFIVPAFAQPALRGSMVFDPVRQECVYFGGAFFLIGQFTTLTPLNSTWTWSGQAWILKNPPVKPSLRFGAAMAFDVLRGETVLFGGTATDGASQKADTWVWNGTTWSEKTPVTIPPGRQNAQMVWDAAREEIVMVGGITAGGNSTETWTWNGTDWLLKTPSNAPPAGTALAMTYDAATQQVVLVAPRDASSCGVWAWNGITWTDRSPASNPPRRVAATFVFSPPDGKCYLFGGANTTPYGDVWAWDGLTGTWSQKNYTRGPAARSYAVGAYDSVRQELVVSHGTSDGYSTYAADTWVLKNGEWLARAGPVYTFDLKTKTDAIWNFTTISIPAGYKVNFSRNTANNPVLWLASDNINIDGIIDVSGANGGLGSGAVAGGPGGYDGGGELQSGLGPGAGRGTGQLGWTNRHGESAKHAVSLTSSTYGTPFAQPLIGGSGGGGGEPGGGWPGGGGGGGGGAIAIASSRDIFLNGSILADGGSGGITGIGQQYSGAGGNGSGGVIRLVADRIIGPGSVNARGGSNGWATVGESGRVRLEGYIRQVTDANLRGVVSKSVPVAGSILTQAGGRLTFAKVAGVTVANPPKGDQLNPDVVFTAPGQVEIEVHALNVPDGTPVTVTINHSIAGVINLPATGQVTLQQCKAVFTATIPAGSGVMQAFATYNVGGPAPAP